MEMSTTVDICSVKTSLVVKRCFLTSVLRMTILLAVRSTKETELQTFNSIALKNRR
jgi:hypothetical protein